MIGNHALRCLVPIAELADRCSHLEGGKFFKMLAAVSVFEQIFQGILALCCLNCDKDSLKLILISLIHYNYV